MTTLSNVREIASANTPSFSFSRTVALLAGTVVVGIEAVMTRVELNRSRKQLAELDDRLLRDIGIDRAKARNEAEKGFWA